jgi:hypothetical protein
MFAQGKGLPHVQHFVGREFSVQVGSLDVDLVRFQLGPIGHGDDRAQRRESGDRGVVAEIVDPFNLRDEAHLVSHNREDSFRDDNICAGRRMLERPGAGSMQSVEFLTNGLFPHTLAVAGSAFAMARAESSASVPQIKSLYPIQTVL